jgi:hypothetical protein
MASFKVKTHPVGGLVARLTRRVWHPWRSWVQSPQTLNKFFQIITNKGVPCGSPGLGHMAPSHSTNKCHVSQSHSTICICSVNTYPCHLSVQSAPRVVRLCHVSYGCATCHTCSGDMCHHPNHPPFYPVINLSTSTCHHTLPRQMYGRTACTVKCHVAMYGLYNHQILACLAKRIDHDIWSIRRSFEPVQVVLGSYRRGLLTRPF